jgi:putative phosphoesterase
VKIAALYDIHGNLPALNAVLEDLKEVQPDLIVVGGDIISGPLPEQTLKRLFQLDNQVHSIRGNGDREVLLAFDGQPINRQYLPDVSEKALEEIHWVAKQLTRSQRDFLAVLPEQIVLQVEGLGRILFCHATPRNDEEIFTPITPDERLSTLFSHVTQEIVVCGHTHMQFKRQLSNLHILNAGSVGMPYADQPGAYWLLLSPQGYEFRRTAYDGETAAQTIRASGNPYAQAFAEENVLKVPTAAEAAELFEGWSQKR